MRLQDFYGNDFFFFHKLRTSFGFLDFPSFGFLFITFLSVVLLLLLSSAGFPLARLRQVAVVVYCIVNSWCPLMLTHSRSRYILFLLFSCSPSLCRRLSSSSSFFDISNRMFFFSLSLSPFYINIYIFTSFLFFDFFQFSSSKPPTTIPLPIWNDIKLGV